MNPSMGITLALKPTADQISLGVPQKDIKKSRVYSPFTNNKNSLKVVFTTGYGILTRAQVKSVLSGFQSNSKSYFLINCGNKSKSFLSFMCFICYTQQENQQVLCTTSNPTCVTHKSFCTLLQQLSQQLYQLCNNNNTAVICS